VVAGHGVGVVTELPAGRRGACVGGREVDAYCPDATTTARGKLELVAGQEVGDIRHGFLI
jgi:hypothetical protein